MAVLSLVTGTGNRPSGKLQWQKIDMGLYYAEAAAPVASDYGDSKVTLLKISPAFYDFKLISAKVSHEPIKTAKGWAKSKGLLAAINAGMYQSDRETNAGYMVNNGFINNAHVSKDNTIAAFNRKDTTVPEFQIIDLKCQNWNNLKDKYSSFTQCIRMIDCGQRNCWSQQQKKWSMSVLGRDQHGNALFIFTRSPYSVHDFINIIKALVPDIYNAMYLEGGPEASIYLHDNGTEIEKFGSYESGFWENDDNDVAWEIPNVIGVVKK